MMRRERTLLSGACLIVMLVGLALPAAAVDPTGNAVADAVLTHLEARGARDVTVESVSGNGGVTTITGLSAWESEYGNVHTLTVAELAITNGEVNADGALSADSIAVSGVTIREEDDDKTTVSIASLTVANVRLPAADAIASGQSTGASHYDTMRFAGAQIAQPDKEPVTIAEGSLQVTQRDNGEPRAGEFRVADIRLPVGALDDDDDSAMELRALGYDAITLDISGKGGWDAASGASTLEEFRLDAHDMGTLTLKAKLGGVTEQVMAALQQEGQGFEQMMGALATVTVDSLSISYDDEGLADKMLDKAASEQGIDRAEFVAQLTEMMPMMLGMLENPEFEQKVAGAVSAFLNAPGNLTISASPPAPVAVPQLFGVAMMAPQTIPSVLAVDIQANQ